MYRRCIIILIVALMQLHGLSVRGQSLTDALQKNAIEINLPDTTLNEALNVIIDEYPIIMMGEMHGTQEPAKFVTYLVRQLLLRGKQVNLGLEIPANQMKEFIASPGTRGLERSGFFSKNSHKDGRSSESMFDLIAASCNNPNINLFFFDVESSTSNADRDSMMYVNIRNEISKRPAAHTIILSGNIHNRLIPFRGTRTAACHLSAGGGKILSINHQFKFGSMLNATNKGFGLHKIEPAQSVFSEATSFKCYFAAIPENTESPYNAFLYTEEVTPSAIKSRH